MRCFSGFSSSVLCVVSSLLAPNSLAQLTGDIVVTSSNGLVNYVQRYSIQSGSFSTLAVYPSVTADLYPTSVEMDSDNLSYLVFSRGAVLRVTVLGQVSTLFVAPSNSQFGRGVLHPTGDVVLLEQRTGSSPALYRYSRLGQRLSTIFVDPTILQLHSIDTDTGDYLVTRGVRELIRVSEGGAAIPLTGQLGPFVGGATRDVRRGDYVVGVNVGWGTGWLGRLSDNGSITTLKANWNFVGNIQIDNSSNEIVGPVYPPVQNSWAGLGRFRADGTTVYAFASPWPGINIAACVIDQQATLSGFGTTAPGGTYGLSLSLLQRAGQAYLLGCSFSIRPGISLGNLWIPLSVDPLLLASLSTPSVFEGFSGTLDSLGRGNGRIRIPQAPSLIGVRVFVSGITIGSSGVSNVLSVVAFTIR